MVDELSLDDLFGVYIKHNKGLNSGSIQFADIGSDDLDSFKQLLGKLLVVLLKSCVSALLDDVFSLNSPESTGNTQNNLTWPFQNPLFSGSS